MAYPMWMYGGNPYGVEGYKTIAYEIVEELGSVPGLVMVPTANADGLFGIWKGFAELARWGLVADTPRMAAAEVIGPLHNTLRQGLERVEALPYRSTCALSIASEVGTYQGLKALRDSGGFSTVVGDAEIGEVRRWLARRAEVLAETAAAAAPAALLRAAAEGTLPPDGRPAVVVSTSCELKLF